MRWFDRSSSRPSLTARPQLELLEDRAVPSATALDLTTRDASGKIGDALFVQSNEQPAGSGVLNSFLRLQAHGRDGVEQGINGGQGSRGFFDEKGGRFNRALELRDVPTVTVDGTVYREFRLDINEPSGRGKALISLDELQLYVSHHGRMGHDPVYDMDAKRDNYVVLNAGLGKGSGSTDALVYVKDSLFSGAEPRSHVYLYSKFGEHFAAEGGFEEWAVRRPKCGGTQQQPGSISGTIFEDDDNSGDLTAGEGGLQDWTVFIDTNDNGVLDDGETSTLTGAQGEFTFSNLPTGAQTSYRLRVVVQDGFMQSSADPQPIVLSASGQSVTGVNIGFFPGFPDE